VTLKVFKRTTYEWSIKQGMSFFSKRPNFNGTYTLAGEKVSEVEKAKYLGVIIYKII